MSGGYDGNISVSGLTLLRGAAEPTRPRKRIVFTLLSAGVACNLLQRNDNNTSGIPLLFQGSSYIEDASMPPFVGGNHQGEWWGWSAGNPVIQVHEEYV